MTRAAPFFALAVLAATATAHADVSCTVSTAGLSFGTYDVLATAPTDSVGDVDVTCTLLRPPARKVVNYSVELSPGGSGNYAARQLAGPGAFLSYNLYTDATRTEIWGNGRNGTGRIRGRFRLGFSGSSQASATHSVYGRLPPGQAVAAGLYADTVIVTVEF